MRRAPLIKELPFTEQPQQRLQDVGPAALSARELLACLLQTPNALSQAQELIQRFGLQGLLKASIPELCQVTGIGPAKAVQLKAAFELGRRSLLDQQEDRFQITSPPFRAIGCICWISSSLREIGIPGSLSRNCSMYQSVLSRERFATTTSFLNPSTHWIYHNGNVSLSPLVKIIASGSRPARILKA